PDYKQVELDYYRATGIFPIMHVTVIKQEIIDKHPWVATNLAKAFEEAKNIAYRRMANPRVVPLAWIRTAWEEQEEVLGADPWAYGLGAANRKNLEAILRYTRQQGLIKTPMTIDELFIDTDLQDAGGPDEPFWLDASFRGAAAGREPGIQRSGLDSESGASRRPGMTVDILP